MDWYYHHRNTLFYLEWIRHDFDRYSRHISSLCVKYRCSGSWRTLDGKMVTFSNKCCNNIPSCLSSWWRWGQCPGWRGRSCARSRHSTPPAHAGHSGAPLPWKRLYLEVWVQQFHKSHVLNELQLIQNMMLVNSKLPKTFEIFTQMSDFVFFPMVPPLHICWNTGDKLMKSGVLFYTILPYFTK